MSEEKKETEGAGTNGTGKKPRRSVTIGIACVIALSSFCVGFGVSRLVLDPQIRSLVQLKNRIQTYLKPVIQTMAQLLLCLFLFL